MKNVIVLLLAIVSGALAQNGGMRGAYSFDTRGFPAMNIYNVEVLKFGLYAVSDLDLYGHEERFDPFDLKRFQWRFRTGITAKGGAGIVMQYHDFDDSLGIARFGIESRSRWNDFNVAVRLYPIQTNGGSGLSQFAFSYFCCRRHIILDGFFDVFIDEPFYVAELEASFFVAKKLLLVLEGKHSDIGRRHVGLTLGVGYVF